MEIAYFGGSEPQEPEPIDKKVGMGDDSPHAKTQNKRPIGGMAAYAWNITLAWFLPRDALLSAVYAVVVCLSVCLSVCVCVRHTPVLYQNG